MFLPSPFSPRGTFSEVLRVTLNLFYLMALLPGCTTLGMLFILPILLFEVWQHNSDHSKLFCGVD